MSDAMKKAYAEIDKSQYETAQKSETASRTFFSNWESGSGKLKSVISTVAKVGAAAVTAASAAVVAVTKQAVDNFAEFEQLAGGAELMFGDAYQTVMKNASEAYKTVQMSQNEYLTQVNGFATGLKTALGGNEQAAAELANRIVTAEADIVAATGNTAENVQNAFNGIMKSNFTMLDNLQIGITPTKEGFQEVIDKVNEWNEANGRATDYQMGNLADMQSALVDYIDMVGMAGYAHDEAAGTIQGSLAMAKAAWENLLTGLVDENADLGELIDNFVESAMTAADQLAPAISRALEGLGQVITELAPVISEQLPGLVDAVLPLIIDAGVQIVSGLIAALPTIIGALVTEIPGILAQIGEAIVSALDPVLESGAVAAAKFIEGVASKIGEIFEAGAEVVVNVANGIASFFSNVFESGVEIASNVINGIVSWFGNILAKGAEIVNQVVSGVQSAIGAVVSVGRNIVEGIWRGISAAAGWLKSMISGWVGDVVSFIKGLFKIHSPSQVMRDEVGKFIAQGIAKGIEDDTKKVDDAAEKLAKSVYSDLKKWADKTVKYNKLSLAEQISMWEAIQSHYQKGSEQYADAEDKLFDLREKRLAEMEATEKKYVDSVKEIYKTIDDLEENYQKQLKDRAQEIYNSYKLFDEIPEREEVSGQKLIDNLRGQIDSIQEFYSGIQELERRGGAALAEEVRQMGVGSIDQLTALLNLSDDKLSEYAALFEEKQKLANDLATGQLKELRAETDAAIQANMNSLADIIGQAVSESGNWGHDLMWNFIVGVQSMEGSLQSTADRVAETINGMWSNSTGGKFTADSVVAKKMDREYSSKTQNISINIDGAGANAEQIGRELYKMMKRKGVAL